MISVSKIFLALCLFCCSARTALVRAADDKILELAKQEARVSFYTTMGADEAKMLADAFQIKYPSMRVEITRLGPRRARASSQRRQAFHRLCAVQGRTDIYQESGQGHFAQRYCTGRYRPHENDF
jgi:hypothetical protein